MLSDDAQLASVSRALIGFQAISGEGQPEK